MMFIVYIFSHCTNEAEILARRAAQGYQAY